jgi:hypothetical protein
MAEKEYIEREPLIEKLKKLYGEELGWQSPINLSDIGRMIEDTPAADVVEVRHGEWLNPLRNTPWEKGVFGKCSLCNYLERNTEKMPDYCAGCGAKMDRERKGQDETRI